jgi:hypothetical protein
MQHSLHQPFFILAKQRQNAKFKKSKIEKVIFEALSRQK